MRGTGLGDAQRRETAYDVICCKNRLENQIKKQMKNKAGVKKKYLTPALLFSMITKVMIVNEILEQALLYDFYGELLTERQQQVYESVVLEDYSLSEVAEDLGISRQGVHDMVKRCNKTLEEYEQKLHLVEKFLNIRAQVKRIRVLAQEYHSEEIANISSEILEEL